MPRLMPPIEHRFTSATAPRHTQKHPNGYLTPLLKRLLKKSITVPNPEHPHGKLVKLTVKDAIVWRRILNACEGDDTAIERIFNRLDGKVPEAVQIIEDDNKLFNEEIDLIPSDGNGKLNRVKQFLKKQQI